MARAGPLSLKQKGPRNLAALSVSLVMEFALIASLEAGRIQFLVHFSLSENGTEVAGYMKTRTLTALVLHRFTLLGSEC